MNNRFHNVFLVPAAVASATGIMLDGATAGNSCFNDFENVVVQLPTSGICYGIYLKGCDSNSFRNILVNFGGASATSVMFDYTGSGIGNLPESNMFYNIDAWGASGTTQWASVGTPNASARPNMIFGVGQANGGSYPDIDNLSVDLPKREHTYSALNLTAGLGSFTLMTPRIPGMFRISYMVFMQVAGTGGTFQPFFFCTTHTTSQIFSALAITTTGGNASGSFTAYADNGQAIGMSVNAAGVTGSPQYGIHVAIERLT
jgi:hypothetical protein